MPPFYGARRRRNISGRSMRTARKEFDLDPCAYSGERSLVRKKGLEPSRYCYRQPLKLVRLPIPPLPRRERRPKANSSFYLARPPLSAIHELHPASGDLVTLVLVAGSSRSSHGPGRSFI